MNPVEMELFFAEREGDVSFYYQQLTKKLPQIQLVCLSNIAVVEAREAGLSFVFAESLFGKIPYISREDWENHAALASEIVEGFGSFRDAANVGWFSLFQVLHAARLLEQCANIFLDRRQVCRIHWRFSGSVNLVGGARGELEPSGLIPVFLFYVSLRKGEKVIIWDSRTNKRMSKLGLLLHVARASGGVLMRTLRVQLRLGAPADAKPSRGYDLLLDGWGDDLEKTFDLSETVEAIAAHGLTAAHVYYDFNKQGNCYAEIIKQRGQSFIEGDQLKDPAKGRAVKVHLSWVSLWRLCWIASSKICGQFEYLDTICRLAVSLLVYEIIVDGFVNLIKARAVVNQIPHNYYISTAGDNRTARARMIASKERGAKQICVPHGFNFYVEPAAMYLDGLVAVGGEGKRHLLERDSGIAADRIVVVKYDGFSRLYQPISPKTICPPIRLLILLTDTHLEWTLYPAYAFDLLTRSVQGLFQEFGDDVEITLKVHNNLPRSDRTIARYLQAQFENRKFRIVYEQWRGWEWAGYTLAFSMDVISTAITNCLAVQVPFIFFSHPYSTKPFYNIPADITVPVESSNDICRAVTEILAAPQSYNALLKKSTKVAKIHVGGCDREYLETRCVEGMDKLLNWLEDSRRVPSSTLIL